MTLKTIYISTIPIDCHILKGRLESEGIDSFIYDENLVWVNPFKSVAIGGVKLKVPTCQVDNAKRILDLISKGKLVDQDGEYDISEALDKSFQRQNKILDQKYLIRNDTNWSIGFGDIQSDTLSQSEMANLITEESEFREYTNKDFEFSMKDFWAELFEFDGRIFKYLRPRPVEYFLDKELVDLYKATIPDTELDSCPNCNSDNVSYGYAMDYKWDLLYLIVSLISAPFPLIRKNNHCFNCGHNYKLSKRATANRLK